MRPLSEREKVINMYFHEGKGYGEISSITRIPKDTVKSWCRRYRIANGIPERGNTFLAKEPVKRETVKTHRAGRINDSEARIARLEMEVELLRNFLILADEK